MEKILSVMLTTIISLMLSTLAIVSCNTPQEKDRQTQEEVGSTTVSAVNRGGLVEEVEIKGHIYLIFDGRYKGNIIHAEHCPCKNTKH